jgi:hypothetical protein
LDSGFGSGGVWEPCWEPFSAYPHGQPWTLVDSKARRSGMDGPLWTPMDTAWRSTDQEVGCSSRPGRAARGLADGHFWPLSRFPGLAADNRLITFHAPGPRRVTAQCTFGSPRKARWTVVAAGYRQPDRRCHLTESQMMPGVWRCSLLEAPGRLWPHVFRDWSPGSPAAVIPGETRPTQGSGILVSSPQDPPADLGKAPGLLAALPGFFGKPYIDLMTFGVWGSIEDACRG